MAKKRKRRNKNSFLVGMLLYSAFMILLIGAGLSMLWKFMEAYEAAIPGDMIKVYEQEELHEDYREFLSAYAKKLETPFQSADEILPILEQNLDESSLNLKKLPGSDPAPVYAIRMGKEEVGKLITKEVPLNFGLTGLEVELVEWTMAPSYQKTFRVVAPEEAVVRVNGVALSSDTCLAEKTVHSVGSLTEGFPELYDNAYSFDYYGTPEPTVDSSGKTYVMSVEEDGTYSVFARCDQATVDALTPFVKQFVEDYILFTSNAAPYSRARQHMIPETALYNRISGSVDGMRWVSGVTSTISDLTVGDFFPFGDGVICDTHYNLTDTMGGVRSTSMRILMVMYEGAWKVYNIQLT